MFYFHSECAALHHDPFLESINNILSVSEGCDEAYNEKSLCLCVTLIIVITNLGLTLIAISGIRIIKSVKEEMTTGYSSYLFSVFYHSEKLGL